MKQGGANLRSPLLAGGSSQQTRVLPPAGARTSSYAPPPSAVVTNASQIHARLQLNKTISKQADESKVPWLPTRDDLRQFWFEYGVAALIAAVWIAVNLFLAAWAAYVYWNNPNFYVTIARVFGGILNFNCALILVPVLRNFLTWIRKSAFHRFIPFDLNLNFHRLIAIVIAIAGGIHGWAHYMNYHEVGGVWELGWTTLPGVTGHLLLLIMLVMYTSSWHRMKRKYYNLFYYSHHLFIIWFFLLLAHGPRFWKWFAVPAVMYIAERIVREYRTDEKCRVLAVRTHPSDVIEIHMTKAKFMYKPGQYLYLCCPYVSSFEYHPFTITTNPEESHVSVHIRCVGPWTRAVRNILAPNNVDGEQVSIDSIAGPDGKRPLLYMDGPFGAASEEVFDFEVVMLVGAGIGVTPFASILKSINHKFQVKSFFTLQKVYFFWICRDYTAFEWFRSLLRELELSFQQRDINFLEINIFLTGELPPEQMMMAMAQGPNQLDPITQLSAATNYGRPDWESIFSEVKEQHSNKEIGLFFCGPPPLGKKLRNTCTKYSRLSTTRFKFFKENF
eukprot:CAMPEP_0177649368 /NCGR_PEP_ID=MMETSP0447-20121125/11346_1 /TAXON_ID=0 /ORGANISM="Stygamoeba regulata, Strain BSH-02190019" /LENGTH=558 /DNA_ID=CAMNT_0019152115 /DNA_START=15 /DNA_END=1691 /DNA_ORIENTATION=-